MEEREDWKILALELGTQYGLSGEGMTSPDQVEELLADKINEMIQSDFPGLIRILYRIDVNETKLRNLLRDYNTENTGIILARLIIERQLEKIQSRRQYQSNHSSSDEERW